ncbi:MAG: pyridoxamine 5'-phosphate oxidase family protein [Armatimonadota bacterium]
MSDQINWIRRRDRAVEDDEWIRAFLRDARYGVVATESGGQPFTNPVLFVYDEKHNAIHFHTGRQGRIFANIAANPRVCLNACQMGRLIADTAAWRFDVAYDSVVVFGKAAALGDAEEATGALRLLLAKYFPHLRYGEDYAPITPEQLARTAVYRLEIEAWSAKRSTG